MSKWDIAVGVCLGISIHEMIRNFTRVLILKIREQR